MNILIIGNGFDLAHKLPTKYEHFLNFVNSFFRYEKMQYYWSNIENDTYYTYFVELFNYKYIYDSKEYEYKLSMRIIENLNALRFNSWIKYFNLVCENRKIEGKDNWIDFESEISSVIQILDSIYKAFQERLSGGNGRKSIEQMALDVLNIFIDKEKFNLETENYFLKLKELESLKEKLLNDLNGLIRGLEIYLSDYINNFKVKTSLLDIKNLPYLDKILSFNYTETYERIYGKYPFLEIDYIHGKAHVSNDMESNNMVLGIADDIEDNVENQNLEFIEFKKYFQRRFKRTEDLWEGWVEDIQSKKKIYEIIDIHEENGKEIIIKQEVKIHKIFIFGHSLDVTDGDILKKFILNDNAQTTIFYMDRTDYREKQVNLIKIIGRDEWIKKTSTRTGTIIFKKIKNVALGSDRTSS